MRSSVALMFHLNDALTPSRAAAPAEAMCVCCVCTCSVELSRSFEEAWQRRLQDHDEVLQLLGYSNQQILVHQVVLCLFKSPSAACIPAHTTTARYILTIIQRL